jgi:glycolate oxidase iron-sulfur subunit
MANTPTNFVDYGKFFDCVHCGLCLSFCPTYVELGTEMDSPRGRIAIMRALHEGRFGLDAEVVRHLDLCLGCRACETACPSGVHYGELIEGVRPFIEQHHQRPLRERFTRWAINHVFSQPRTLRLFALFLRLGSALDLGRFVRSSRIPRQIRYWFGLVPEKGSVSARTLLERFGATNEATVKVLQHNGCEVLVPRDQVCCGALLLHNGNKAAALDLARRNVEVFGKLEIDALIINAAGCGAMMKEYGELCKGEPAYHERAERLVAKMKDVTEFLGGIPLKVPTKEIRAKVTYHDACHLAHGQGLQMVELHESDWCCGSAGTYNLTEPDMAHRLLGRKVDNIQATNTDVVVTGNPGCLMQIRAGLQQRGLPMKAVHTVDLLAEAYDGEGERKKEENDDHAAAVYSS